MTPNALTGEAFVAPDEELDIDVEQHKCSAFAATGPATRDGDIVFGQIFMWGGYTGVHWNVITDVVPTDGHRLVYHTFPGGIHSGADFYLNEAGIVIGETTVSQTPYEADSTPQSNRIRKAAQYASSIDDVERILWEKQQRDVHQRLADRRLQDRRGGHPAARDPHQEAVADPRGHGRPSAPRVSCGPTTTTATPRSARSTSPSPTTGPSTSCSRRGTGTSPSTSSIARTRARSTPSPGSICGPRRPINRAHACDGKITNTEMAERDGLSRPPRQGDPAREVPHQGLALSARICPDADPHLSLGYSVVSPIFVTDQLKAARGRASKLSRAKPTRRTSSSVRRLRRFEIDKKDLWRGTVDPASPAESWFVSATAAYWRMLDGLDDDDPAAAAEELASELAGSRGALSLHGFPRGGSAGARRPPRLRSLRPLSVAADQGHLCPPPAPAAARQRGLLRCDGGRFTTVTAEREMTTAEFHRGGRGGLRPRAVGASSASGSSASGPASGAADGRGRRRPAAGDGTSSSASSRAASSYRFVTHLEVEAGGDRFAASDRGRRETRHPAPLRRTPDPGRLRRPPRPPGRARATSTSGATSSTISTTP